MLCLAGWNDVGNSTALLEYPVNPATYGTLSSTEKKTQTKTKMETPHAPSPPPPICHFPWFENNKTGATGKTERDLKSENFLRTQRGAFRLCSPWAHCVT